MRTLKQPRVLTVDIGGNSMKMLLAGRRVPYKVPTGKRFTPAQFKEALRELPEAWQDSFDYVSVGFPGRVAANGRIRVEPLNLGKGWVNFDFSKAFGKPTKVVNDAVLQAIGSYEGGRMLYIGLGTGVGSALIVDYNVMDFELGALLYHQQVLAGDAITKEKLRRIGKSKWNKRTKKLACSLRDAFLADYVILGGGNADELRHLPKRVKRGDNRLAFKGGERLWQKGQEREFVLLTSRVVPEQCKAS